MSTINSLSNQLLRSQLVNAQLQSNSGVSAKSPGIGDQESQSEEKIEGKNGATPGLGENLEVNG